MPRRDQPKPKSRETRYEELFSEAVGVRYRVRHSTRAKRVRLVVSAREGLVVVVPRGACVDVESVIASRSEWIDSALRGVEDRLGEHRAGAEAQLPSEMDMRLVGRTLPVEYRHTDSSRVTARIGAEAVMVSGNVDDAAGCVRALRRLADREAASELSRRLDRLTAVAGVHPRRLRVGAPRSRWGSCSARGTVSLSRNLLFLPPELVDYVIVHELVHLKHLDHSPRFHAALEAVLPGSRALRTRLRDAREFVPVWADE